MFDAKPDWPDTPAFLRLYVRDCATVFGKVREAGATLLTEPTLLPWGEREARVRDPFGNIWWMMEWVEDLPPDDVARRFLDPDFQTAMAYVQGVDFIVVELRTRGDDRIFTIPRFDGDRRASPVVRTSGIMSSGMVKRRHRLELRDDHDGVLSEGRAQTEENIVQSHCARHRAGDACPRDCAVCGNQ